MSRFMLATFVLRLTGCVGATQALSQPLVDGGSRSPLDPAALLATVAHAAPDTFLNRDVDPDDVVGGLCADDEPAIDVAYVPALDRVCAHYLIVAVDRRNVVMLTRGERFPVAIGYSLGTLSGYVAPIIGQPQ